MQSEAKGDKKQHQRTRNHCHALLNLCIFLHKRPDIAKLCRFYYHFFSNGNRFDKQTHGRYQLDRRTTGGDKERILDHGC
jgi:hypothetical protein